MIVAEFAIPLVGCELLTPNVRRRKHWRTQAKITKDQRELARSKAPTPALVLPAHRSMHLTLVRGPGQRLVDPDALGAACKPLVDGIVDAGLLAGDSSKYLTVAYSQERGPRAELRVRVGQP